LRLGVSMAELDMARLRELAELDPLLSSIIGLGFFAPYDGHDSPLDRVAFNIGMVIGGQPFDQRA
jgi:hypothetical protein